MTTSPRWRGRCAPSTRPRGGRAGRAGTVATTIPYHSFPLIHLGPITLRTFGLTSALGVLLGVRLLTAHLRRVDIDADRITSLAVWIVLFGFVGARLTFVLSHAGDYVSEPWRVVAVWEGGLQFFGGFVLAIGFLLWWLRRNPDVPGLVLADGLALGLAAGLIVGRVGCFAVGEHLGHETRFPLAIHYLGGTTVEGPLAIGVRVHSTALYEGLGLVVLLALLFTLRRRGVRPGTLLGVFTLWYGIQRFSTDFLRAYDKRVLGLTGAQYTCIALVAFGAWWLLTHRRDVAAGEVAREAAGEGGPEGTIDAGITA
ncbi:MAG TPA: prolipoprotein diacylglyceryl transferase family protein [Acidimicrobiales bacterium]|nr:prolipoprotein diacylglyceryl transferase family protein [Acidimicrobiales bacterium]